jgi:hypothetical protein
VRALVGAVADAPEEKRLAPAGAYSIRLADIDTRLDHITVMHGEISERLRHIEEKTAESSRILTQLWVSIRRHPLLSKFIREN